MLTLLPEVPTAGGPQAPRAHVAFLSGPMWGLQPLGHRGREGPRLYGGVVRTKDSTFCRVLGCSL